jgi:hypothetical protein
VCVNHLKRCKTSTFDFTFPVLFALFHFKQEGTVETAPNEAIHLCWKQSLINSVYLLLNVDFEFLDGDRLSLEPACRTIGFCFSFFFPAQLSQSFKRGNDLVQMDKLRLARTLKEFLRTVSRLWSSTNSCHV